MTQHHGRRRTLAAGRGVARVLFATQAIVYDLSVTQHDDPIGHRGMRRIVGDHENRLPFADEFTQQVHHLVAIVRVEIACRFVGQE